MFQLETELISFYFHSVQCDDEMYINHIIYNVLEVYLCISQVTRPVYDHKEYIMFHLGFAWEEENNRQNIKGERGGGRGPLPNTKRHSINFSR